MDLAALPDQLIEKLETLPAARRYMVGITGAPGAGKSTISERLVHAVNEGRGEAIAAILPMDGFHLPNVVLHERGLHALKGIPKTFDAEGFVAALQRARTTCSESVFCPSFDRAIEEPIQNSIEISPAHRLVIVEGNYLLLDDPPWNRVKELLDEVWYLEIPLETIMPRLISRHIAGGRDQDGARAKVESTDLPNARLIASTKKWADRIINLA